MDSLSAGPCNPFGPEHEELRQSVRSFIERELQPHAAEWEKAQYFPDEVFVKLAEQGFLGLKFPESVGGQGGDHLHEAVFVEELAGCHSGGLAAGIGAHCEIAASPVFTFGTPDQHERYLRPAIEGKKVAALAITEPGAGSDVASLRTTATKVDGGWTVSGEKTFITGGVRAGYYVTAVRTKPEGGHGGISFLIVDQQDAIDARPLEKLGWHASDTATVAFDEAFVPDENLLGELHGGFKLIMANFAWERLTMALGSVAAIDRVLTQTIAYTKEREAFGKPLTGFQVTRHTLADLRAAVHIARCVTYDALQRFVTGDPGTTEAVVIAKLHTQRAACDLVDACLQLHGGAGYMTEVGIERAFRDARLGPIGGGTDEIMREILSKIMGL
ncbi:MAG: acyl-CoA dehydrogenase family protein [Baekduia sp.]